MIYFDTSYIARLYLEDRGWAKVRQLAATDQVACSLHGRAETIAAFHRKLREGAIDEKQLATLLDQFDAECKAGAFQWLAISPAVIDRAAKIYRKLPSTVPLRAADALHLATAAENSFLQIYSNDTNFLASAPHFSLRGINII